MPRPKKVIVEATELLQLTYIGYEYANYEGSADSIRSLVAHQLHEQRIEVPREMLPHYQRLKSLTHQGD